MKQGQQIDIPGIEPDHPEMCDAIYNWLDAKDEAASEGKRLRDTAKTKEATALEMLAELKLKSYAYLDREGKRRRFLGATETKAKTVRAPASSDKPAKKTDAPAQDRDEKPKPTKAERDAAMVESRRVPRTAEHDQVADPFGQTRGLLDQATARQLADDAIAAADAMGARFVVPEQDGGES